METMRCTDLPVERLDAIVSGFSDVRVTVIGDYSLDRYGQGEVKGVSRETGQRVPRLWWHSFNPGGAGNVAWNLADMGGRVHAACAIGDDGFGGIMTRFMEERGIDLGGVIRDDQRITGSYEKIQVRDTHSGEERELRIDVDNENPIAPGSEEALLRRIECATAEGHVLVAADYNEEAMGVLTDRVTRAIVEAAEGASRLVAAISRTRPMAFAPAMLVVNEYEACHATGVAAPDIFDDVPDDTVHEAARAIVDRTGRPAFVTLGSRGMLVMRPGGSSTRVATLEPRGPIDITGAGDSALAGIVLSLAVGASPEEAACVGNLAAYVTIHKVRATGTATPAELRAVLS
ncbi:MAG: hypothetical protein GF320_05840 [Armatimonadia bacterium]|nr:hypothetical protein [Armatimonadia bacterium]